MMRAVSFVTGALVLCAASATAQTAPRPAADALWEAARKGDAAAVTAALDAGVDVNTPFRYGATALSYACDRGHLEVVRVLLARGANPNVKDSFYGATPLTWASSPAQARKPEHAEVVGLLLKYGAQGADGALGAAIEKATCR
jgi:ankyrin repeat protein